jgi:hypothetical protein
MGAIKVMYLPCYWKTDPLFKMECYMHENISFASHSTVQLFYTNPKQNISDDWQGLYWTCSTAALNI